MSEITEENDGEDVPCTTNTEDQKERIRQIIKYQKAKYLSSSSSSSAASASSCSSFSYASSSKSSSLLDLMKEGSTSLRRLFDMEHISLASHFKDYSGSPVIRPILLWGSDTDEDFGDGGIQRSTSWKTIKQFRHESYPVSDGSVGEKESSFPSLQTRKKRRRLIRTTSYKKLPGINLWRFKGFRFRFRLRRLRIMICGKML